MYFGNLLHISYNMWEDWKPEGHPYPGRHYDPNLRCDPATWTEITAKMAEAGMNLVVLDLGDGIRYESHPEIAVHGAWTTDELRAEIRRLRDLGLEPIPKLNFATTHDAWLHEYSRMVSSQKYYEVCADLIKEVTELFDTPRFFHLGMDEEGVECQKDYEMLVIRQHDLWWHDLYFFVGLVEKAGSRSWVWSDYAWHHPKSFYDKMPKSVVQSNWYYEESFVVSPEPRPHEMSWKNSHAAYLDLADHGYDQIPTASNWSNPVNFGRTVEFCKRHIPADKLKGFLQTPWQATLPEHRLRHLEAIDQVREVIAR